MSSRIEDHIWADAQDCSPADDGAGTEEIDCFDAIRELAFGPKTYMQLGQMAAEKLRAAGAPQSMDAADAATLVSLTVGAFAASAMEGDLQDTTIIKKI